MYNVQPRLTQTSYNFNTNNIRNMSSNAPLLGRILANSVSLANKSAQIARDIMASGELGVTEKTGIDDLQTKADRCIVVMIQDISDFGNFGIKLSPLLTDLTSEPQIQR